MPAKPLDLTYDKASNVVAIGKNVLSDDDEKRLTRFLTAVADERKAGDNSVVAGLKVVLGGD